MKKIIFIIGLMFMAQNALGEVKCNLFNDTVLKSHCNKMKIIENKIKNLKKPDSASNLSFLLEEKDVKLLNKAEFDILQEKAKERDQREHDQKLETLKQRKLLYFKEFLVRKQEIGYLNEATRDRNSLYGLIEEGENKPKRRGKKPILTDHPIYGKNIETYVW